MWLDRLRSCSLGTSDFNVNSSSEHFYLQPFRQNFFLHEMKLPPYLHWVANMAASSAAVENVSHSILSFSEKASSIIQSSTGLPGTMASAMASAKALVNSSSILLEQTSMTNSWSGTFGRATLFVIKVIPGILYWLITFATITMPTFLFTLFSTSLTFTMNATTLWVCYIWLIICTNCAPEC